jgi:hypothetical protein
LGLVGGAKFFWKRWRPYVEAVLPFCGFSFLLLVSFRETPNFSTKMCKNWAGGHADATGEGLEQHKNQP